MLSRELGAGMRVKWQKAGDPIVEGTVRVRPDINDRPPYLVVEWDDEGETPGDDHRMLKFVSKI